MTDKVKEVTMEVIMSDYNFFVDLVSERRQMPRDQALKLSDGRVFTGNQALENKLIDAIGGEDEAIKWLVANKGVDKDLAVRDLDLQEKEKFYEGFVGSLGKIDLILDYTAKFIKSTQSQLVIR
jgi:protease-4